eukprot:COSAG02_NODE_4347_length_5471_cov_2.563477_1_plen_68_part_10
MESASPAGLYRNVLLVDGSNNFDTYSKMQATPSKHPLIFHCLMTVLFADGRVKAKGVGRLTLKPRQPL